MSIDALTALPKFSVDGIGATRAPAPISGAAPTAAAQMPGDDFATVLANVASNASQTMRAGEAAAIAGIEGKASTQQVVDAVMSAEQTLRTALAIRDKVVSAYQEISRMAI